MKRIMAFLAVIIMMVNMAACSSSAGAGAKAGADTGTNTNGSSTGTSGKPKISVYYMVYNNFVYNAICEFKTKFGNVDIEAKTYNLSTTDDFGKSLSTEILTGGGPDVIVCRPLKDVDSISKVFSNGAFADLNDFISKDKEFKLGDYNRKVIDAGVFNGRREFLPIYYYIQTLYTTEGILKQNNLSLKENCTINDLGNITKSFLKNKSGKSKYLFDSSFSFYYLMNFCGDRFLDYKSKKCNFDSDEFKSLLRLYKDMQPAISTEEIESKYGNDAWRLVKNNIIAFETGIGSIFKIYTENNFTSNILNESVKTIELSGLNGNGQVRPVIWSVAAINNNCRNKEYAFEFIKILLSDNIQKVEYGSNNQNTSLNPVNNTTFNKEIKKYSEPATENSEGVFSYHESDTKFIPLNYVPLSDALVKHITDISNNMAEPVFIDKSVKDIIDEALKDYLSDKSNEDQTALRINDKVELFLNE